MTPSLALAAAVALGGVVLLAAIAVAAWRRRPWPDGVGRQAVGLATLGALLRLPYQVLAVRTFDVRPVLDDVSEPLAALMASRMALVAGASTAGTAVGSWLLAWLCVPVAQAVHARAPLPRPTVAGLAPWLALGVALGGWTGAGQPAPDLTLHPGLAAAPVERVVWQLSGAVGGVVGQELLWRGVVQGALARRFGAVGVGLTAVLAAGPAAVGHAPLPAFVLALVLQGTLGVVAWHRSVTHSLATHFACATVAGALAAGGWVAIGAAG